jgi:hypothetical protein
MCHWPEIRVSLIRRRPSSGGRRTPNQPDLPRFVSSDVMGLGSIALAASAPTSLTSVFKSLALKCGWSYSPIANQDEACCGLGLALRDPCESPGSTEKFRLMDQPLFQSSTLQRSELAILSFLYHPFPFGGIRYDSPRG